jgi:TPR repeat protein
MKIRFLCMLIGLIATCVPAAAQNANIRLGDIGAYGLAELGDDATAREFASLLGQDKEKEALAAANRAADKGLPTGHFLLGWAAENGRGREASLEDAEKAYREGAKRNHIPSVTNLAVVLMKQNPVNEEAVKLLRSAEEKDPKIAGFFLGVAYLGGSAGTPDFASAAQFWTKAAAAGSVIAQRHLGYLFEGVFGFPAQNDIKKAADAYRKAADADDAEASIRLGLLTLRHSETLGLKPADAPKWFEKAATSDNPAALFLLAQIKEQGVEGYPADVDQARALYQKGANQDHGPSILKLGFMLERGLGGAKDEAKAIELYRKSAELGEAGAYFNLGILHQTGRGVDKDEKEAFRNFLQAGLRGFAAGATQAGSAYRAGAGVTPDPVAAAAWFERAATAGESNAMINIAEMMLNNQLPVNAEMVTKLSQQAFNLGNPRAGLLLGRMSERGVILQQNRAQALAFYRWAAKREMEEAKTAAAELEKSLTKEEIEAAAILLKQLEENQQEAAAGETPAAAPAAAAGDKDKDKDKE